MNERWTVRCDCIGEDGHRRTWRETCWDCADATATAHRNLGHTVTLKPYVPEPVWTRSVATDRLTARRGW